MACFEVRLVCIKPCGIHIGYNRDKYFERGNRTKAIIQDSGIAFWDSKEQCYSCSYLINDIADCFKITGSVQQ